MEECINVNLAEGSQNSQISPVLEFFIMKKSLSYVQSLQDFGFKSFSTYYLTQNEI